ncbi:DUF2721 domain-containing protein [Lysobacter sp. BMK333-48F3]|uniref:DUF2721 domain-containing protein n=1 Tax=Lysobacter sp. BMK333-48F3 TaxID=2867962 RepID=UPI001C8CC6B6|nr:DUF2721 domain-containing protein [Lysobacter sp. BMK333-48F3]MBX9402966.1 DUF2721 domain-containing protein [Lysobacter sp. BMK333-48F3]
MADPLQLSQHYSVVSAMITPAFFLTATASLLVSSNNRLARIVDRLRQQLATLEATSDEATRVYLEARIILHRRRVRLVLICLQLLYGAMTAFVATSLAIGIDQFTEFRYLRGVPTGLAMCGVLLVLAASVNLGREARMSVTMLDAEVKREFDRDNPRRP